MSLVGRSFGVGSLGCTAAELPCIQLRRQVLLETDLEEDTRPVPVEDIALVEVADPV